MCFPMTTIQIKGYSFKFGNHQADPAAWLSHLGGRARVWTKGFSFPFVTLCIALSCLGKSELLALSWQDHWELWGQEAYAGPGRECLFLLVHLIVLRAGDEATSRLWREDCLAPSPTAGLFSPACIPHWKCSSGQGLAWLSCLSWTGMGLVSGRSARLVLKVPLAFFSGPESVGQRSLTGIHWLTVACGCFVLPSLCICVFQTWTSWHHLKVRRKIKCDMKSRNRTVWVMCEYFCEGKTVSKGM